jgi:hypothetical protein
MYNINVILYHYLLISERIGWTHQQQQNGTGGLTQQQKLLKSLTVIVSVHVGTSLFGSLLLGFSFLYSTITTWYMMTLSLCIILVGACSNAIVLYMNRLVATRKPNIQNKQKRESASDISDFPLRNL